MRTFYLLITLLFALPLVAGTMPTNYSEGYENAVFRIEDAKSRVSFASVKLSVGDLTEVDGDLVGDYTIRVPLMQSKNDHGRIVLPLHMSMAELGKKGGTLIGHAISQKEGNAASKIVCQVIPQKDQAILLAITTDNRTIEFTSRYRVIPSKADG